MGLPDLPLDDLAPLAVIAWAEGMVRGVSGFALSALVMTSAMVILPPTELIPACRRQWPPRS